MTQPNNPLPSELRAKPVHPIGLQVWEKYFGDYAFVDRPGKEPIIGKEFCAYLGELFEQEYQRRIKAAKPNPLKPEFGSGAAIFARVDISSEAIDQYEHNLKQLSEGGRQVATPLEGEK